MTRRLLAVGAIAGALGIAPTWVPPALAGGDGARPSPPLSTPAERAERAAGLELLAVVPGDYDERCLVQTRTDLTGDAAFAPFEPQVEAGLRCQTDDGVTLHALKLADAAAVDAMFDAFTPVGLDPNLAGCESERTWGNGRGRVKCYRAQTGAAAVAWTAPDDETLFGAYRVDGDIALLNTWWESSSPPIDDPRPDELVSDSQWRDNANVLRRSVPKRFRRSCDVPAISEEQLGPIFRDRLALRTVLHCDPDPTTRLTLLDFRYRENARAYVSAHLPADQPVVSGGLDCPGAGYTSSNPKSDDLRLESVCFVDSAGHGTIVWYDDQQGIALRAVRTDDDLEALLRFYRQAGPVPNPKLSS